jgi:hypothetical protein
VARISADADITAAELKRDASNSEAIGGFAYKIFSNYLGA